MAQPSDAAPKGPWWRVFNDALLDELESAALSDNQTLVSAVYRVEQARAVARVQRSESFPGVSFDPAFRRERTSGHLPTPIPFHVPVSFINTYSVPFDLSYEVDLWGRVRRSFESAQAQAQASVSDFENVRLTLAADVAANYFLHRALESEVAILKRTVGVRGETVKLLTDRFQAGVIAELDLTQARTELATVKADLADATRQRALVFDALALLCGRSAGSFEIPDGALPAEPPDVPAGLPSALLERRPDVSRAERTLAAKSAEIGVAKAAYFPVLRLTGQAGFLSAEAETLFDSASRVWSFGPSISLPLFTGGRTGAEVERTKAAYQEALATYKQSVLAAFKDVDDSLAEVQYRAQQAEALTEGVAAANRTVELAQARYETGTVGYLEKLDAERTLLQQERGQSQVSGQRLVATVRLIKALGGAW